MRAFLFVMATVALTWGLLAGITMGFTIYRMEAKPGFWGASLLMAPSLGVMVGGALLYVAAEVLGFVQRRMRQMDAEDNAAAARARARKHAEKVAAVEAKRAAKAAKRAGKAAPIDFQVLDGGGQHGGN